MMKSEAKAILKLSCVTSQKSHRLFHITREKSSTPLARTPQQLISLQATSKRQIGLSAPVPAQLISTSSPPAPRSEIQIHGNASQEAKELCSRQLKFVIGANANGNLAFGYSIARRLRITRVDVGKNPEEPKRTEAQVVCEITVEPDMANVLGTLHGGCIALLLDVCTSLPCNLMAFEARKSTVCGVSQNINILYHAPGHMGSELRITSTLVSYGSRVISSRCEIWDKTHRRLISTGGQTMMQPSHPTKTPDYAQALETAI